MSIQDLQQQISDEIYRLCNLTVAERLLWDKLPWDFEYILEIHGNKEGEDTHRCIVSCSDSKQSIVVDDIELDVPDTLVALLRHYIVEQITTREKRQRDARVLAALQKIIDTVSEREEDHEKERENETLLHISRGISNTQVQ